MKIKSLLIILIVLFILPKLVYAETLREKKIGNYWYLVNENGEFQTGFQHLEKGNRTVYYDSNGRMKYGQQKIDGYWYLFDKSDGNMLTGFQNIPEQNKIVYYNSKGQMQYNFQNIDGSIYYFDTKTGAKAVGIVKIDDKYYYFDTNGKLVTKAGEIKFNGYWYLLNEEGIAQTGFQHLEKGNRTVYYDSNGRMKYGQQKIDGYWYLFDKSDGNMLTGFQSIPEQNKIVYYNSEGQMQYGNQTIDNHKYYFDIKTGAMKSNFVYKDGKTYYYFEDGKKAIGWVHIAGTKYFFNSLGDMIGKNVKKVIDVSAYEKDIDWDTVKSKGDIDGVIIRISASAIKEDTKLARNISEVKRLHIPYGVYIYSYAEDYNEGEIYAEFAVKMIKKYSMNPTLGIYFDLEKNKITDKLGTKEYTEIVKGFMNVMNKNGYSKLAKIYTYTNYANTALNTEYLRNQIDWIAHYNNYTTYKGKYNMWQYTSTAQIPGISGNVDVSVKFN